jgi:hypothetical protein
MSREITPEQREEAALAAIRDERKSASRGGRRGNPVIDVDPTSAATTLAEWVIQSQGPGACRASGAKLSASPFRLDGISASGAEINLAAAGVSSGSVVWAVLPMLLNGKRFTMLIGAVRLSSGDWCLIRRTLTVRGNDAAFVKDEVWYETRRKRTHVPSESGGTRRKPHRR